MTTRIDSELKREIMISGTPYTVTLTPDRLVLALKGRRKGLEIKWLDLVSGEAALATALNASLTANLAPLRKAVPVAAKGMRRKG
jgi:multisubunit Na+/H+ antiporter MnhE subunit